MDYREDRLVFTRLSDLQEYYKETGRAKSGQAHRYLAGNYGEDIEFYVVPKRAFGYEGYGSKDKFVRPEGCKPYRPRISLEDIYGNY